MLNSESGLLPAACRSASAGAANLLSLTAWVPRLGGAPRGGTGSAEALHGPRLGGDSSRGVAPPSSPQSQVAEGSAGRAGVAEDRTAALPPLLQQAAGPGGPSQRPCQEAAAAHEDAPFGSSNED